MNKCISYKYLNKENCSNSPYNQFGPECSYNGIKPYFCNYYCNCNCNFLFPREMIPLTPQIPPSLPGRIVIGEGIFSGIQAASTIGGTLNVPLNTDVIVGGGMVHNNGDPEITLLPNTTYEYFYRVEIEELVDVPASQSFLTLSNVPIADSIDLKVDNQPGPVIFMHSGVFTTDNTPNPILRLRVVNLDSQVFNLRDAVLMLRAIQ